MAVFKFRNLKSGQATPVPAGEFTVGRAEDSYIQVDDSSVSRHHARLINSDQGFFLEDLGSANGVALHGAYVTGRAPMQLGDLVHIGKIPFRIDPETPGENTGALPGDLRKVDRAFMQRNTERITAAMKEAKAAPEPVAATPPEPLSKPAPLQESKPANAPDAKPAVSEEAKTALPPEAKASGAITFSPTTDVPPKRAPKSASDSGKLIRQSVALPALAKLTESRPVPAPPPSPEPATAAVALVKAPEPVAAPTPVKEAPAAAVVEAEGDTMPWWWWAVVFLAGLGSGLLLGLFFAKIFLDMGGRPSALP